MQTIQRQVDQFARLADDMMDASAVLGGNIGLRRAPVDFGSCVSAVVDSLRATPILVDHTVHCRVSAAWVDGDLGRLEQIVTAAVQRDEMMMTMAQ